MRYARAMRRLALLFTAACGSSSSPPPPPEVESQRFVDDLNAISGPREPGSAHWQEVQDLCAERFEELGFTVERHAYATGVNVVGVRTGTRLPDERVAISAHYDSTNACAGADDNGSGVAGTLEAARVLAGDHARTLVVACWDEEERGLIGSRAFVERAAAAGEVFVASYVFEMIGYRSSEPDSQQTDPDLAVVFPEQEMAIADNQYRGDFILVIHDSGAAATVADFEAAALDVGLRTITLPVPDALKLEPAASGLRRSDHAPFWVEGFPAIQLTDTADFRNPHYHCGGGADIIADIDVEFATQNIRATAAAVALALDR